MILSKIKMILFGLIMTFSLIKVDAQQTQPLSLTQSGKYVIGCNYWASHAGTNMWNDWRPDVLEADLKQMSEDGIQVIRVFPVWPDFQPIYQFYRGKGALREVRFKDGSLSFDGPGKDGVSIEALGHFRQFADMAEKHNIKLIVGLVTGWMSGRLLVPQALEGKNILTDPTSIMWQVKLVRNMVHEFKNHPAVLAWDLGNECNEMAEVENYQAAYVWTASITNAIKAEDKTRPVVSGMHSLTSDCKANWRIQDQAELTDLLTTHPYPFWTPYTNQDPANTIRTIMHSSAETRFYGDIGGKPCLVEETGIMGPMEANELNKSKFLRSILFNNWANDCQGLLWWCAYDQNQLDFPPYEWSSVERDLGMYKTDRSAKPVVSEFRKFRKFIDKLPFQTLPQRRKEAVCILSDGQDQWAVAYSSFILAKQAGLEIEFQHANQPLKDAPLYLLPCVKGTSPLSRTDWLNILEKVNNGAILYVSFDQGFLSHFIEPAGIEITTSQNRTGQASFISNNESIKSFSLEATRKLNINPTTSKVLAHENDGNPVFTVNKYGKGKIYFLAMPLEMNLTRKPGTFSESSPEFWKIYETIGAEIINKNRVVTKSDPFVGITEHDLSVNEKVIILVNFSPTDKDITLVIKSGWKVDKAFYGNLPVKSNAKIMGNDACVLLLKK